MFFRLSLLLSLLANSIFFGSDLTVEKTEGIHGQDVYWLKKDTILCNSSSKFPVIQSVAFSALPSNSEFFANLDNVDTIIHLTKQGFLCIAFKNDEFFNRYIHFVHGNSRYKSFCTSLRSKQDKGLSITSAEMQDLIAMQEIFYEQIKRDPIIKEIFTKSQEILVQMKQKIELVKQEASS